MGLCIGIVLAICIREIRSKPEGILTHAHVSRDDLPVLEVDGGPTRLEGKVWVTQNGLPVTHTMLSVAGGELRRKDWSGVLTVLQPSTSICVSSCVHFRRARFMPESSGARSGDAWPLDWDRSCRKCALGAPAVGRPISSRNTHPDVEFSAGDAGSEPRRCLGGLLCAPRVSIMASRNVSGGGSQRTQPVKAGHWASKSNDITGEEGR